MRSVALWLSLWYNSPGQSDLARPYRVHQPPTGRQHGPPWFSSNLWFTVVEWSQKYLVLIEFRPLPQSFPVLFSLQVPWLCCLEIRFPCNLSAGSQSPWPLDHSPYTVQATVYLSILHEDDTIYSVHVSMNEHGTCHGWTGWWKGVWWYSHTSPSK